MSESFAKLLCGRLDPLSGAKRHHKRLEVGYFAQHQLDELHNDWSPYDYFCDLMPDATQTQHRVHLVQALDDVLDLLSGEDPLAAKVLKLKYYGGLSVGDAADVLGVSRATAYRHWTYARAWLLNEMTDGE